VQRSLNWEKSMVNVVSRCQRSVLALLFIVMFGPFGIARAESQLNQICVAIPTTCSQTIAAPATPDTTAALKAILNEHGLASSLGTNWLPGGETAILNVDRAKDQDATTRFFAKWIPKTDLATLTADDYDKADSVEVLAIGEQLDKDNKPKNKLALTIGLPKSDFWQSGTILLTACSCGDTPAKLLFVVRQPVAAISPHGWAVAGAVGVVLVFFLVLAFLAGGFPAEIAAGKTRGQRNAARLNPLWLISGDDGRASLSMFQILFFTLLVAGLMSYILLRTGQLSDLSSGILLLLGIASVGSATAQATEATRRSLAPETIGWLTLKGWMPKGGYKADAPRLSDLFTDKGFADDRDFNPYRFQMFAFSLIVGGALLAVGARDLAQFDIPHAVLELLGLSQVVYIGNKAMAPVPFQQLDQKVAGLRAAEDTFVKDTAAAWIGTGADADKLARAKGLATPEYVAFVRLLPDAKEAFNQVYQTDPQPGGNYEPGLSS
jgi:hypothetical protein